MRNIGQKIVIVGVSASGKSTFARKLSSKTGLPLVMMDSIMWKPNWTYIGDQETIQELEKKSSGDRWIIEGYINTEARSFLFEKADTIIYLDYSRITSSLRYIKRWWKHRKQPRPELKGSPDTFSFKFLWLIFTKGESIILNKFLDEIIDQSKIIKLTSPHEATSFISKI